MPKEIPELPENDLVFALPERGRRRKDRPNVVVFFTDQQRYDTAGVHGNPLGLTPNFDRVAREGTLIEHSFTVQPVCGPSRACMQTGRYATQTGCFRNGVPLGEARTLARDFGGAGYHTGYIGKWHLADREPVRFSERGGYGSWLASNKLEFTSDAYHAVVLMRRASPSSSPATASTPSPTRPSVL